MSFKEHLLQQTSKAEQELEIQHDDLMKCLKIPQLVSAFNTRTPKIVNYVINHLKEIIDIAIGQTDVSDEEVRQTCIDILSSKTTSVKDAISQRPSLFNHLANRLISGSSNQNLILQLFQGLIEGTSGKCLNLLENPKLFFKSLLEFLPSPQVLNFILDIFGKSVQQWVDSIHGDEILLSFLEESQEPVVCCILLILNELLTLSPSAEILRRLTRIAKISQLFDVGIESPTIKVAQLSFQLLISIFNRCHNNDFDMIAQYFASKSPQLCHYITCHKTFGLDKKAACEILNISLSPSYEISENLLNAISFVFDLFFEMPTNDFLHIACYNFFEGLSLFPELFSEFLEKHNVFDRLLEVENRRDTLKASFWGHCTQIELLLEKTGNHGPEQFCRFVEDVLKPRKEIMDKNYGGKLPRRARFLSSDFVSADALFDPARRSFFISGNSDSDSDYSDEDKENDNSYNDENENETVQINDDDHNDNIHGDDHSTEDKAEDQDLEEN